MGVTTRAGSHSWYNEKSRHAARSDATDLILSPARCGIIGADARPDWLEHRPQGAG